MHVKSLHVQKNDHKLASRYSIHIPNRRDSVDLSKQREHVPTDQGRLLASNVSVGSKGHL